MKKYALYVFAFVAVAIGVAATLNFSSQRTAPSQKEILLRVGEKETKLSYGALGISASAEKAGGKGDFGLASLLSSGKANIRIDEKLLAHAIVSIFPFLNLPEDAHASFFITSADQKIKPTFNLRKLVADLSENASGSRGSMRGSAVEVEIIPKDFEVGKEVVLKLRGDSVPTLEWKIAAGSVLDEGKLRDFLENQIAPKVNRTVKDATVKQFTDEGKAVRVEVDGLAQDGVSIPIEENMKAIKDAVLGGASEVFLEPQIETAFVYNDTGVDLGDMELISVGRSNFAGSPEGRAFNIQKGLSEKINNIIVPPGAEFSFNSFLGPITAAQGWKKALGIFGGGSLAMTLGGGLCQVSTTVYRAALLAGLPIVERKPHSLYVKYYKEFGEGLDATVFSTGPDMVFLNDTPSYIFIQSYVDGDDAYVKVFGAPDGRKSTLEGPYRSHDIPAEEGYKPSINEIVWFRTVEQPDGATQKEMITSRYKALPRHPR